MPKINIDMILSDPMLLVGTGLVAFGLLLFLISLWKLAFHSRSSGKKFVVPEEGAHEEVFTPAQEEPVPEPQADEAPVAQAPAADPLTPARAHEAENGAADKTVIMQAQETEMQMQLDIIVSQLKNLNKKMGEFEERLETVPDMLNTPQEMAALKEPPINPEDYAKKLLKLAEHVIMLEKEVARLKDASRSPEATKPPIMPL